MLVVKIKLNTEVYTEENPLLHCRSYRLSVIVLINVVNAHISFLLLQCISPFLFLKQQQQQQQKTTRTGSVYSGSCYP